AQNTSVSAEAVRSRIVCFICFIGPSQCEKSLRPGGCAGRNPRHYVLASSVRHEAAERTSAEQRVGFRGTFGRIATVRPFGELDDPRRRILIQALAAGFFSSAGTAAAQMFGRSPGPLAPGQSV